MENHYLIAKALHLIVMISWMCGMLYLPRLYVYHVDAIKGGEFDLKLQIMEKRLYYYIMTPAMILTLLFGLWLIMIVGPANLGGWFHAKMALLLGMFAIHGMLGKYRRSFTLGKNTKSARFYRIINEIPTLLMIAIILLAVIKP